MRSQSRRRSSAPASYSGNAADRGAPPARALERKCGGRILLGSLGALSGAPPFGLFVSELLVVYAGVIAKAWVPLGIGIVGLALAFAAIARMAIEIEAGAAPAGTGPRSADAGRPYARLATATAAVGLCCALALAIVPWSHAGAALQEAAAKIGRGP